MPETAIITEKPIFVISDLHIGDGSRKDNLSHRGREKLLYSFLEYVDRNNGELIITGDLFELWRHRIDVILEERQNLLEMLSGLDVTYVPGNHDSEVLPYIGSNKVPHKFFKCARRAFYRVIGPRKFKFMHGHEVDPLIPGDESNWGRIFGKVSHVLSFKSDTCVLSNDGLTELFLGMGEQALMVWSWLSGKMNDVVQECRGAMPNERITALVRTTRTRKMLMRYYHDRAAGLYDVAIVGHTHQVGRFDDWYFNSGSWTGQTNDFIVIRPDGKVEMFDWSQEGARITQTLIGDSR